jgi:beta-galactosidase/beta-glucuronidase
MATHLRLLSPLGIALLGCRLVVFGAETEISANWRFQMDAADLGEKEQWHRPDFDRSAWGTVSVPKAWDLYDEALWGYEGVGWYAVRIEVTAARPNEVQGLKFGRVNYHTKVWLNGEFMEENTNGYLPFAFDVTGKLRPDTANLLVLRVDNRPRLTWLPAAKQIEWIQYGGILGPVTLETRARIYISDLRVNAIPDGNGAAITGVVEISSRETAQRKVALRLEVDGFPQMAKTVDLEIGPATTSVQRVSVFLPKAEPWSPEKPFLYTLFATVESDQTVDRVGSRFGVRKIETRGREILINGQRFRAKGVNRYDELGKYGPNPPRELLLADLRQMKAAGVNMVRVQLVGKRLLRKRR